MAAVRALIAGLVCLLPGLGFAAELLVLNKGDSTLSFVDPASGRTHATIATGEGPHEIELSSDGKLAFVTNYGASTDGNTLSVVDVQARKEAKRVDLGDLRRPHGLTFSNGKAYFSAERARKVGRYNPTSQQVDWTFETGQDGTHMVLASRDGAKLFTTNMGSNTVSIIESASGAEWRQTVIDVGDGPEALDESPDGRELWTAQLRDGHVSIIDPVNRKVVTTFDVRTKRSNRLKFTPDGKTVLISDLGAGELVAIDAEARTEKARIRVGSSPTGILVVDNDQAYVAVSGDNRIAVIDLAAMKVARTIATGNSPDGMALVR